MQSPPSLTHSTLLGHKSAYSDTARESSRVLVVEDDTFVRVVPRIVCGCVGGKILDVVFAGVLFVVTTSLLVTSADAANEGKQRESEGFNFITC